MPVQDAVLTSDVRNAWMYEKYTDFRLFSFLFFSLSAGLDLAGRFLFAILTLMTLIANLVFIEEVVYIYRKIHSSKRSILIWINAAAPVSVVEKDVENSLCLEIHVILLDLYPPYNPPPFLCR